MNEQKNEHMSRRIGDKIKIHKIHRTVRVDDYILAKIEASGRTFSEAVMTALRKEFK